MKKQKPIAIFGGSFDPIHLGHCRVAIDILQQLNLQEIRFVPCKQPVHKEKVFAAAEHRQAMVKLAIEDTPGLVLDNHELERDTPSYMLETLQSLRSEVGEQPLCLIIGIDAFMKINTWHQWQELINYAHFIVIQRPNYQLTWPANIKDSLKQRVVENAAALQQQPAGSIYFHSPRLLNISATEIRQLIKEGKSPRFLLSRRVLNYIQAHGLYK